MDGNAGVGQSLFNVFFQVVTHIVGFFNTGVFGHDQMQVNKALTTGLPTADSMETGKLAAEVPKAAIGFTVQTPQAVVVDLGTDFGVSVDAQGVTEAHVFAGTVEVAARAPAAEPAQPARELRVGQAVKIRSVGAGKTPRIEEMAAAPDTFVRRVPASNNTGLPEPRILFAHRGDRDPTTEGWKFNWHTRRGMKAEGCRVAPIDDQGTLAWSIDDRSGHTGGNYQILAEQGLTQISEAFEIVRRLR